MNALSQNPEPALGSDLSPDLIANSRYSTACIPWTVNSNGTHHKKADVPKSSEQRENTSELQTLICKVTDARAAVVLYTIDEVDRRLRGRSSNTRPSLDRL